MQYRENSVIKPLVNFTPGRFPIPEVGQRNAFVETVTASKQTVPRA